MLPDNVPTVLECQIQTILLCNQLVRVALSMRTGFFWNHDSIWIGNRQLNMIASNFFWLLNPKTYFSFRVLCMILFDVSLAWCQLSVNVLNSYNCHLPIQITDSIKCYWTASSHFVWQCFHYFVNDFVRVCRDKKKKFCVYGKLLTLNLVYY